MCLGHAAFLLLLATAAATWTHGSGTGLLGT
jgi:hypothetical protein